jgi:hypothetical protein
MGYPVVTVMVMVPACGRGTTPPRDRLPLPSETGVRVPVPERLIDET